MVACGEAMVGTGKVESHGCCLQDAVTSAGPLLALLGFVVLPFVWSLPEALVTAELATAFPEDSG